MKLTYLLYLAPLLSVGLLTVNADKETGTVIVNGQTINDAKVKVKDDKIKVKWDDDHKSSSTVANTSFTQLNSSTSTVLASDTQTVTNTVVIPETTSVTNTISA